MTFKVGDKIRRTTDPVRAAHIGFETVVVEPEFDAGVDRVWYVARDGDTVYGDVNAFELIQNGPVRTVTRQEIIPGTYDGVWVTNVKGGKVSVKFVGLGDWADMTADELERAAAVLTALAGALRDEQ